MFDTQIEAASPQRIADPSFFVGGEHNKRDGLCLDGAELRDAPTKTEASAKDVPLDGELAESLLRFRESSPYNRDTDWVFASQKMKGKQPLWPDCLWNRHGKPAVKAAKVAKRVSYHTFRHTFGTLLNANGENPKVVQELVRHATLKVTTDTYLQALSPEKREAQTKFVRMVLGRKATA